MNKSAATPRPMGGFNQGFGDFNEHLDENALQAAAQQKTLAQQGTIGGPAPTPPPQSGPQPGVGLPPAPPREISTIKDELIHRPIQDIGKELAPFFDINALLGIKPEVDDPQTQAHKKQLHSRWENLTQEQQQLAQKNFQLEMEKKKQEQEQAAQQQQQAEQARADTLVMPTSRQTGTNAHSGSRKANVTAQLEHDRKTLSGPRSVN